MSFRIGAVHAFVAVGEDDEEGIVGAMRMDGQWFPFIAADETKLEELRPQAQQVANENNVEVRHIRLSVREDIETLTPKPQG